MTLEQYHQGHRNYQNIKGFAARARKHDATKFPLAERLILLHELCSEFGSHADISSFAHRISVERKKGEDKGLFKLLMFQIPDTDLETRGYLVQTLLAYTHMAKVFSGFVGGLAVGLDFPAWSEQLDRLEKTFAMESHKIDEQTKGAENVVEIAAKGQSS